MDSVNGSFAWVKTSGFGSFPKHIYFWVKAQTFLENIIVTRSSAWERINGLLEESTQCCFRKSPHMEGGLSDSQNKGDSTSSFFKETDAGNLAIMALY